MCWLYFKKCHNGKKETYPKQLKVFRTGHMTIHFNTSISVVIILVVVIIIVLQISVVCSARTSVPSIQGPVVKVILIEATVSVVGIHVLQNEYNIQEPYESMIL